MGPIARSTFFHVVENIDPCIDYYYSIEIEYRPSLTDSAVSLRSEKTAFKTFGVPVMISDNPVSCFQMKTGGQMLSNSYFHECHG